MRSASERRDWVDRLQLCATVGWSGQVSLENGGERVGEIVLFEGQVAWAMCRLSFACESLTLGGMEGRMIPVPDNDAQPNRWRGSQGSRAVDNRKEEAS